MRKALAILLLVSLIGLQVLPALAATQPNSMLAADLDGYGMVVGGTLNMRTEPRSTAKIVATYSTGTWLRIIGGRAENDYFYAVAEDGKIGYLLAKYVVYSENYGPSNGDFLMSLATVAGSAKYVNMRKDPDSTSKVLSQIKNGTRVLVEWYDNVYSYVSIEKTDGSGWLKGWMSSGLLVMDSQTVWEECTVSLSSAGKVNLRGGPLLTAPALGSYAKNTPLIVLIRGTHWSKVFIKGKTGYMMNRYLSVPISK